MTDTQKITEMAAQTSCPTPEDGSKDAVSPSGILKKKAVHASSC